MFIQLNNNNVSKIYLGNILIYEQTICTAQDYYISNTIDVYDGSVIGYTVGCSDWAANPGDCILLEY